MRKSILITLIILTLAYLGCGGGGNGSRDTQYHDPDRAESKTIASVGASQIKLSMIEEFDKRMDPEYNSAQEEFDFKKMYVDSLINLYLLVEEAYDQGVDKDAQLLEVLEESRPDFIRDELFKKEILPHISVSDQEAEMWYEKMKSEPRLSVIFLKDSLLADSLYTEIKNGASFENIARQYSDDSVSASNDGDIGYVQWTGLSNEFRDKVFDLEIGEPVVFKVINGWSIGKVTERREVEMQPYSLIKDNLKSGIQQTKRARFEGQLFEQLYEKADIKINDETLQFIDDKVKTSYPPNLGGREFRYNTFNPEELAEYEKELILATYIDGELTLGEYLYTSARWNDTERPPFENKEAMKRAVFKALMYDILLWEAKELELDKTDSFKDAFRFFKDQMMAVRLKEIIADEVSYVSDDEVSDYYTANRNDYIVPQKLNIQEIMVATEAEANEIYQKLEQGQDFGALAEQYTISPGMKSAQGNLGFIADFKYPVRYAEALGLGINQYSKPFPVGNNWAIVKLLDARQPEAKTLEQVASQIRKKLSGRKLENSMKEWMESLTEKYKVEVDYDVIWESIDKNEYE